MVSSWVSSYLSCQRHLTQLVIHFSWKYILHLPSRQPSLLVSLLPHFLCWPLLSLTSDRTVPRLCSWPSPVLSSHTPLVISSTQMISYTVYTLTISIVTFQAKYLPELVSHRPLLTCPHMLQDIVSMPKAKLLVLSYSCHPHPNKWQLRSENLVTFDSSLLAQIPYQI